jgi:hypothetical protein
MFRFARPVAAAVAALLFPVAAAAQDQAQIQVFGGAVVRDLGAAPLFGGAVGVPLGDNVVVNVEGGRLTDVLSPTLDALLDFTPVDVQLSALYGQAGVRIIASPGRAARPYAEASAGFARMSTDFDGTSPEAEAIVDAALRFLDRTEPILNVGGGVVVQGGAVFIDLGYRYTKIVSDNPVQSLLTGGDLGFNQFRIGAGVSF